MTADEYALTLKTLTEEALADGVDFGDVANALLGRFTDLAVLTHQTREHVVFLVQGHYENSKQAYEARKIQ